MDIVFEKYQGTGNDFIIIDNRKAHFDKENKELITALCERKFGIGSDGLIIIQNSNTVDFEMLFFNPDGSQSFCGNGSRCAVAFAYEKRIIQRDFTTFLSTDGIHEAYILNNGSVKLKMNDVSLIEQYENYDFINTGSPHYITYCKNVDDIDVLKQGRAIRYSSKFNAIGGTNVNFLQQISANNYKIRTYERGVENETLSCGTGITAAALSSALKNGIKEGSVTLEALGGTLTVDFIYNDKNKTFNNVWLTGNVAKVFEGKVTV